MKRQQRIEPPTLIPKSIILMGGGGHAKVLLETLQSLNYPLRGITDPHLAIGGTLFGLNVLGNDDIIPHYSPDEIELVNGIGALPNDRGLRTQLFNRFSQQGYHFKTVINPTAIISPSVQLLIGVQVMAGAIIQADTRIANNSIINSGAIIEHDCHIGEHVHIAPGAILSGGVEVGDHVHIGTGAVIIQGIKIGTGSIIGAGSVVTRNVGNHHIVYPARTHTQAIV